LFRPRRGRKIAGVCAGVANYLNIDPTLVRIIWFSVAIAGGGGFLAYLIAWFVMTNEEDYVALKTSAEGAGA
jgi:phage shock protein PspC (stress-responsive transcriptional regulator)